MIDIVKTLRLINITSTLDAADEIERLTRENDFLRARAGNDDKECVYCGLGARDQGKCQRGFPGCTRADDQQLCRKAFVCMERDELRDEIERLRGLLREARPAIGEGQLAVRIDAALGNEP